MLVANEPQLCVDEVTLIKRERSVCGEIVVGGRYLGESSGSLTRHKRVELQSVRPVRGHRRCVAPRKHSHTGIFKPTAN